MTNEKNNNPYEWVLVVSPYQKEIYFREEKVTLKLSDFYNNPELATKDDILAFGSIVSYQTWFNNEFIGVFGEICIVNLTKKKVKLLDSIITINKTAKQLVHIANGKERMIFWNLKAVERLMEFLKNARR